MTATVSEHEAIAVEDAQKGAMLAWVQAIAPYGIFTTDTELKIRTWNQWLVTHSGLAPDEVLGRSLTEVFPDIGERRLDEHFRRALDGEISVLSTALHKYLVPLRSTIRSPGVTEMLQTARIERAPGLSDRRADGSRVVAFVDGLDVVVAKWVP